MYDRTDDFIISQAAQLLGVSPKTLRGWERCGLIKATYTDGGHRRYSMAEIRRVVEERKALAAMLLREPTADFRADIERAKSAVSSLAAMTTTGGK